MITFNLKLAQLLSHYNECTKIFYRGYLMQFGPFVVSRKIHLVDFFLIFNFFIIILLKDCALLLKPRES